MLIPKRIRFIRKWSDGKRKHGLAGRVLKLAWSVSLGTPFFEVFSDIDYFRQLFISDSFE